jgi:hypothetical protein
MHAFLYEKQSKKSKSDGFLEICIKDFDDYKDIFLLLKAQNNEYKKSNSLIEFNQEDNITELHKNTFSEINDLVNNGKENVAFSLFFNTFPTCLPHRNLIKLFQI